MKMFEQAESVQTDTECNVCEFKRTIATLHMFIRRKRIILSHFDFRILHNKSALTGELPALSQ